MLQKISFILIGNRRRSNPKHIARATLCYDLYICGNNRHTDVFLDIRLRSSNSGNSQWSLIVIDRYLLLKYRFVV